MSYQNIAVHILSTTIVLISTVTVTTWGADTENIALLSRTDIMGYYTLYNREQCRRLCWYRQLCASYSYNDNMKDGPNCILRARPFEPTALPKGWLVEKVTDDDLDNTCSTRPCAETEVCVPDGNLLRQHNCLPFPASCGAPRAVDKGSWDVTGILQGDVATLTCDAGYELIPGSTSEMTCAVTSRWTPSVPACRVVCENGGSRDGFRCLCPLQYSGTSCERYIRDCTEAYSNGYNNTDLNGPYSIQPRDAPTAFLVPGERFRITLAYSITHVVLCLFEWGGVTVPFRRQHEPWENLDWAEAKAGRTGDLSTGPDPWDFFAGLESLHYLSHQAEYSAQVSLWGGQDGAGVFYQNFTIGDESSSYALNYNVSYPREHTPGDDGFQASSPLPFSTQDRDTHGCAGINGAPGWYGPDCTEYSLFAKPLTWPVLGINTSFSALVFHWSRDGAFYDGVR